MLFVPLDFLARKRKQATDEPMRSGNGPKLSWSSVPRGVSARLRSNALAVCVAAYACFLLSCFGFPTLWISWLLHPCPLFVGARAVCTRGLDLVWSPIGF